MSAPDTNLNRQKSRHRGVLIGLGAVVGFALLLFLGLAVNVAEQGQTPGEAPATTAPANG